MNINYQKIKILILFIIGVSFGIFGYANYTQAATFADCPTSYGTIVCGAGEQYCGTCTTGIADNRSPQWTLNCGTCSWSCPAPNVTCGSTCGPAYSGENPTCVTKKVTTDQCGNCTTTCRTAGDTYCSSTGTCLTPTACAGGSTWNGCSCVANPYILANPSSAQSAYMNITGNGTFGGDIYMADSKAIRVDGSGDRVLNFGNFFNPGITGLDVNFLQGQVYIEKNDSFGSPLLVVKNTSGGTANIRLASNSTEWGFKVGGTSSSENTKFSLRNFTGGLDTITLLASGNVGINTSAPGAKLEVNGQSMFGGSSELLGSGKNLIYGNVSVSAVTGNLLLLQKGGANRFVVDINGNATTTGHFSTTELCLNNDCKTTWPTGTGYWTQTGSSLYPTAMTSQVAIGTTNPSVYTLMVENSTNGWPVLFKSNTSNGSNVLVRVSHLQPNADPRISFGDDNPVPNSLGRNFWNMGVDNSDSDKFKISTNFSSNLHLDTKLTIDYASGNVGIGTATPSTAVKLDLNGGVKVGAASGNIAGAISYSSNDFWGFNGTDWLSLTSASAPIDSYWTAVGNNINSSNTGNVTVGSPFTLGTNKLNVNGGQVLNGSLIFPLNIDGNIQGMNLIGAGNGRPLNITAASAGSSGSGGSVFLNPGSGSGGPSGNIVLANLNGGKVGVGTASPNKLLHVYKISGDNAEIDIQSVSGVNKHWGIYQDRSTADLRFWNEGADRLTIDNSGNVGIGITNPDESLYIYRDATGPKDAQIKLYTNYGAGSNPWSIYYVGDDDPSTAGYNDRGDLRFWTGNNRVVFTHDGAVVAGGLKPSYNHPIAGTQWKFWSEGDIGINGNVYAYGGNFYVSGGDVAEEFEADTALPEGTVVVMGDGGYKSVKYSNKPYDQTVVGVVSDDAGVVIGHVDGGSKAEIAMVGVVGVKVTNENGAIKRGDLLVSSSLSGHAMKDTKHISGTIIGKALEDFGGKSGNIKALINLQ